MKKMEFPEIDEADLLGSGAREEDFFKDSNKEKQAMNQKILSPLKSIRLKCMECSNYSAYEVKHCPITDCNLYAFRLGRNPNIKKRELTPEQREALADRFKKKPTGQLTPSPAKETATI